MRNVNYSGYFWKNSIDLLNNNYFELIEKRGYPKSYDRHFFGSTSFFNGHFYINRVITVKRETKVVLTVIILV